MSSIPNEENLFSDVVIYHIGGNASCISAIHVFSSKDYLTFNISLG